MGRQIIKQPNGKYAVFSSIVDHFIWLNITREEYIQERIKEVMERTTNDLNNIFDRLEKGENVYHQFQMDWDEAIDWIEVMHGKDDETLQVLREEGLIE